MRPAGFPAGAFFAEKLFGLTKKQREKSVFPPRKEKLYVFFAVLTAQIKKKAAEDEILNKELEI